LLDGASLPARFADAVMRAIHPRPALRFPTMRAFAEALGVDR
jgi:hypothetical protein